MLTVTNRGVECMHTGLGEEKSTEFLNTTSYHMSSKASRRNGIDRLQQSKQLQFSIIRIYKIFATVMYCSVPKARVSSFFILTTAFVETL